MRKLKRILSLFLVSILVVGNVQAIPAEASNITKLEIKVKGEGEVIIDDGSSKYSLGNKDVFRADCTVDTNLRITATTVRVPVLNSHSESINVELNNPFEIEDIFTLFENTPGLTVYDNVSELKYPTPLEVSGKDDVYVGRIRRDFSIDNGLNLWVVADNIRKGAALNAVQIAEVLINNNWL